MMQMRRATYSWFWSCILYCTLLTAARSQTATNCSAVDSFVEVLSPSNLSAVLTSSHALFAPFAYYVPATEIAVLNASIDDVCNNTFHTDIANKIVLMFAIDANCSNSQKLFAAQSNNANAVLLVSDLLAGEVTSIADDDDYDSQTSTIQIPMRGISHIDGTQIRNAILSGVTVTIQFGCYTSNDEYPSQLCILDTAGDIFWVDGNYQRQLHTMNAHPVWKKKGYASHLVFPDFYVYLHDDWRWSISFDATLQNDDEIVARCADTGYSDPLQCPTWNISSAVNRFSGYEHLQLSDGLCSVADALVCIGSQESHLRGLDGTYQQFSAAVPVWFRRLRACDSRVGVLEFSAPYYVLYDVLLGWTVAMCQVEDVGSDEDDDTPLWQRVPPSECEEWWSLHDDTLQPFDFFEDATMSIAMDTECETGDTAVECVVSTAPEQLCMARSSVLHGFLEGAYVASGVVGDTYDTLEYTRHTQLYYDGEDMEVYLWFLGEVEPLMAWWVIADVDLSTMMAQSLSAADFYPWAYCEANTSNPINCGQHWNFDVPIVYYDGNSLQTAHTYHSDAYFELYAGVCDMAQVVEEDDYEWPSHICIALLEEDEDPFEELYVGGYVLNDTATTLTTTSTLSGGYPHWIKPAGANDPLQRKVYLYFDAFWGWWQIGLALHDDRTVFLICFQEHDYSPLDCSDWYDTNSLSRVQHLRFYACSESEALGGDDDDARGDPSSVVIPVVVVLLLCGCFALFWYYWRQSARSLALIDFPRPNNRHDDQRDKASAELPDMMQHQQQHDDDDGVEDTDDARLARSDSNAGLAANAQLTKIDFRPLTTEDTVVSETQNVEHDEDEIEIEHDSQLGDDDEKKEEAEQGSLDVRRMSAAKVDKMQKEIDQWTTAMIDDPIEASRRYSRGSPAKPIVMPTDLIDSVLADPQSKKEESIESTGSQHDQ